MRGFQFGVLNSHVVEACRATGPWDRILVSVDGRNGEQRERASENRELLRSNVNVDYDRLQGATHELTAHAAAPVARRLIAHALEA